MIVTPIDVEKITAVVKAALDGRSKLADPLPWPDPVYVALRRKGLRLRHCWRDESDLFTLFRTLRREARFADADCVELCLSYDYKQIPPETMLSEFGNVFRGIKGIEILIKDKMTRIGPTEMIAANRDFQQIIEKFIKITKIPKDQLKTAAGHIKSFNAHQFLIQLRPKVQATRLFRGNRVINLDDITPKTLAHMIETMSAWMFRHVNKNGRMTYKYWPSNGKESSTNNTIRQFMATLCLIRLAKRSDNAEEMDAARRNLDYNLKQFLRVNDGVGTIEFEEKAKLGATALAALSILEMPQNDGHAETLDLLSKGVEDLWNKDGSFTSFHKPAGRNDNQNFYPGEALLFWANLYTKTKDAKLLKRCMKSFAYYRDWHRKDPNPAFIPWHTQAYALLYAETGDKELRDFIFEMNDWLVPIQQWDNVLHDDLKGRFFDPEHPEYGPPHASSTGVYLEGLSEAFKLAKELGEKGRADLYEKIIWRGLRSLRQMQFLDDVDMYYISKRRHVEGGVRIEAYSNEIRVDNVQHPLIAMMKLSDLQEFS